MSVLGTLILLLRWALWIYGSLFALFLSIYIPLLVVLLLSPTTSKLHRSLWDFLTIFTIASISGFLIPVLIVRPKHWQNAVIVTWVLRKMSYVLGLTWEVRGANFAAEDKGAVVCCNHQSSIDLFAEVNYWSTFNRKTTVSKKELFYVIPFGPAAMLCNITFIDRKNAKASYETLKRMQNLLVEERTKVLIYPEGTRNTSGNGGFLPFKKGAFITAIQAQVPIMPMVIAPYYYDDEKAGVFVHSKKHNIISILDPIPTKGMTEADTELLKEKVFNVMLKEYQKLKEEVSQRSRDRGWVNRQRPRLTIINRKPKNH